MTDIFLGNHHPREASIFNPRNSQSSSGSARDFQCFHKPSPERPGVSTRWVGSGSACFLPLTALFLLQRHCVHLLPEASRGKCNRVWEGLKRAWDFNINASGFDACANSPHPRSQPGRMPGPLPFLFQSSE